MPKKTRTKHSAAFKAKVALEAVQEHQTIAELAVTVQPRPLRRETAPARA